MLSLLLLNCFPIEQGVAQSTLIPLRQRITLGAPPSGFQIYIEGSYQRSFCCTLLNSTTDGLPGFTTQSGFFGVPADSLINRGFSGNATGPTFVNSRRKCWHEDPVEQNLGPRSLGIGQPGVAQPIDVMCEETTLIGGFNTSVTDFNFLELSATSDSGAAQQNISGVIILSTTVSPEELTIPFTLDFAGATEVRQDFSIHDRLGGRADFGQVQIIHNAAPGVLKGRVTQYRIITQEPLDFEPVLQEILVRRAGK